MRELLDDFLDHVLLTELAALWNELEHDACSALKVKVVAIRHFIGTSAIGDPAHALGGTRLARKDLNMVRHDKR